MNDATAPTSPSLHVVLGATGGTGSALVQELVRRDLPVRAVTRSGARTGLPAAATVVSADLLDVASTRRAIAGASVVYHAANPPYQRWLAEFPAMNAAITDASAEAGAKLVFADNLYAYGPTDGPRREITPQRATDRKGQLRIRLAADLLDAHAAGRLRVTIGRSSDYFGPGGRNSSIGERLFQAAIAGKPVRWLGSTEVPHSVSYLPDVARALVTLGLDAAADGRAWHLPVVGSPTGREFVAAVAEAVGHPVKVTPTSRTMVRIAGIMSPLIRELVPIMYQWERPFVSDTTAYEATFGPTPATSLEDAVAATVAWFRSAGPA
jgi:nucleoside-diphosphate-sugar epimerase